MARIRDYIGIFFANLCMVTGIVVAIVIAFHIPRSLAIVVAFVFVPRATPSTVESSVRGNGASVGTLHKEIDLKSCNVFFLHMATILSMDFVVAFAFAFVPRTASRLLV